MQHEFTGGEQSVRISEVQTFILHAPVTNDLIGDSTHKITHWGMPGVRLIAEGGLEGWGYTGTHAVLATDRLVTSAISEVLAPILLGADPREVRHLHRAMTRDPNNIWMGRGGILQMAISAVDIALWDLKAKIAGEPLWKLLGGSASAAVEGYSTDCGWLVRSQEQLVDDCRRMIEVEGFRAVKIKVGKPNPHEDLARIEAVRRAIGPQPRLMIDANGKWDIATARQFGPRLADYDITWFEEPLWHDDVEAHAAFARSIQTPIALGELLYTADAFRSFVTADAVHYLQPDATRCGGLTSVLEIADLGLLHNLPVTPHHGDMMQAQLHLVMAHPACTLLEFIPWTLDYFVEPVAIRDGFYRVPELPGAGTTLKADALNRFSVR
jgi:L-alanine-DL-glutamate epimerase-like enolase superfamily enzyme